ncbi:MAG TPA: hypothetical protein VJQ52_01100 [Steroidobacteraceae bacterium]|nr:hypothetical protein [Steroidobacteraceae bacterium]
MTKIALVLAIAAVGEGLVSLHLVNQLHKERETAQTLQARVIELEQKPQQAAATGATFVAVPREPPASPFTTADKTKPTPPPPAAAATVGVLTPLNSFVPGTALAPVDQQRIREQMTAARERQRQLLRDPEYREAMLLQQKMGMRQSSPNVARELNLTAEQADRLFETLAEQSLRSMENMDAFAWGEQPDPARLQEMQRIAQEQQQRQETELKRVLGEGKYREWQEYQNLAGVRWEADRVRTSLANAGLPLDEALAKPLMKTMQEQQQKMIQQMAAATRSQGGRLGLSAGPVAATGDNLKMQQDSLEFMARQQRQQREAMARVLSPEQIKVIEEEHAAQLEMQRAQLRIMRAQQEAGGLDPAQNGNAIGYAEQAVMFAPSPD